MSVSDETISCIKAQLRQAKASGGVQADLYNHLAEVFNTVIKNNPNDAYEKFEAVSALVKQTKLQFQDPCTDEQVNARKKNRGPSIINKHVSQTKNLLNGVKCGLTEEDKDFLKPERVFCIPNFVEEAEMLDWAGLNFGKQDTYKLQLAIKRLAETSGADKLRFCGKIYGTQSDYWVACGELPSEPELRVDVGVEPRGIGVNTLVYWATDHVLHDWIQLPDCRPEHIEGARLVKRVMTGNLNASIVTNPPFPGKERHFLRAQLARIFHATAISPKGMYEMVDNEQEGMAAERRFAEEFPMPTADELKSLEAWSNTHPIILGTGWTAHVAPPGLDEDAANEWKDKMEASDPSVERFRDLTQHKGMPGTVVDLENPDAEGIAFLTKIVGDVQNYTKKEGEGTVSYCVNVIRSLRWPGAVTVCKGSKYTNVYIGHGLKRGDNSFSPTEPPEVMKDPTDQPEMPEPTPLLAPEEPVEEDTDKEAEEAEEDFN